jgi:hypothetical protein
MSRTSPPNKPLSTPAEPISPVAIPGKTRYGLMNTQGQYLVHAYKVGDGWSEWNTESHDAIDWVSKDSVYAAAKVWFEIHDQVLIVVRL